MFLLKIIIDVKNFAKIKKKLLKNVNFNRHYTKKKGKLYILSWFATIEIDLTRNASRASGNIRVLYTIYSILAHTARVFLGNGLLAPLEKPAILLLHMLTTTYIRVYMCVYRYIASPASACACTYIHTLVRSSIRTYF